MTPRRLLVIGLATIVVIGFLFVAVFPTRTYLAQRRQLAAATDRVEVLAEQNERLAYRAAALRTDAEIERQAHEQHHLVRPGEESFAIISPPEPVAADAVPPARAAPDPSLWDRVTDTLTFWD